MTAQRRVLVVEDDPGIAELLVDYLRHDGYFATRLADGQLALSEIRYAAPDLLILDLMLPGLDGVSLCKAVREFSDLPILMLTARVHELDRLLGLNSGADDYVCKPFSPREVMARVQALLRRAEGRVSQTPRPWQVDDAGLRIAWRSPPWSSGCSGSCSASPDVCSPGPSCWKAATPRPGMWAIAPSTPTSRTCAANCRRNVATATASPRSTA